MVEVKQKGKLASFPGSPSFHTIIPRIARKEAEPGNEARVSSHLMLYTNVCCVLMTAGRGQKQTPVWLHSIIQEVVTIICCSSSCDWCHIEVTEGFGRLF